MIASELIALLQEWKEKYGDLSVFLWQGWNSEEISSIQYWERDGNIPERFELFRKLEDEDDDGRLIGVR